MSIGFERIRTDSQLQDHWLRRLVAFIIDSVIVGLFTLVLVTVIAIPFILLALITGLPWYLFDPFAFPFFTGIISILYFTLLEAYYEGTFGKRIMNLKTTKLDGQKPTLDSVFIRNVSKIYWILVLIDTVIGLATVGDPHQKLSDRYAGTTIVSTGASPFAGMAPAQPVKLCIQCGHKLPADAKYCPYCGKMQG